MPRAAFFPAFAARAARGEKPPGLVHAPPVLAAAFTLALGACGDTNRPASSDVVIDTVGDTVVVLTVAGGVWESTATLVPEASVGELDGADEYLFGTIRSIAVDGDHTVYVLDSQAQEVRVFDSEGTYLRTLGGPGEGPGEFTRAEAIALLPDGRLVVRDAGIKQIKVFGPGPDEVDQWPYSMSGAMSYSMNPIFADAHGRTFQTDPGGWTPEGGFGPDRIIVLGPDGTHQDTIPEPWGDYEEPMLEWERMSFPVPFSPYGHWAVNPAGHLISAFSADYRIDVARDDGVLRIEREAEPARASEDERSYYRAMITEQQRADFPDWRWEGPAIPDRKPFFDDLIAGRDGRIWVALVTEASPVDNPNYDPERPGDSPVRWRSELRYDVFEADGTYLGAVDPPDGYSGRPTPVFDGDLVWAASRDELGVPRLVRYRIVVGEADRG